MHSFKIILKIIFFSVLFIFFNFCLTFCLTIFRGEVEDMWFYFNDISKLDMIFVGSSECSTTFDPEIIDNVLHCNSYNMGSNVQSFESSYKAIIEAAKNKDLKTVILTFDYGMLNFNRKKNFGSEMAFLYSNEYIPCIDRLKNILGYGFEDENYNSFSSIICFFPWVYYHNKNIILNINEKMQSKVLIKNNDRSASGFVRNIGIINNKIDIPILFNYVDINVDYPRKILEKICKFCNMNGIDLLAIEIPSIDRKCKLISNTTAYYIQYINIKGFFRRYDVDFFDFNFIKPDIYKDNQTFYKDVGHFNMDGAQIFSTSFAHFLKLREQGQDVEKYFYTPEECLESIDYISAVSLMLSQKDDSITIDSLAYCGSLVKPEYQFLIRKENDKDYLVIKDYSNEAQFLFKPPATGKYTVRVNTREFGSNDKYTRYNEKDIIFQK